MWRFHAFFTTTDSKVLDTVAADKTQRGHAVIEQVHSDLKNSALAHLPSGVFTANAAWLVLTVIASKPHPRRWNRRGVGPCESDHRDAALVTAMATSGAGCQLALAPAGTGKTTAMRALTTA